MTRYNSSCTLSKSINFWLNNSQSLADDSIGSTHWLIRHGDHKRDSVVRIALKCSRTHTHSHARRTHFRRALTCACACVCVWVCTGLWVCERVAATLSIPRAGARVETYWIRIRYQYSRPWTHTHTHAWHAHIHTRIWGVRASEGDVWGTSVQPRDYPMCGKIRFRCRCTAQAANRKAAASWLDKFEWPKWPPNGQRLPANARQKIPLKRK